MEGQLLAQIASSGNIVYVHNNQVNAPLPALVTLHPILVQVPLRQISKVQ
jgi:hypothetical protein